MTEECNGRWSSASQMFSNCFVSYPLVFAKAAIRWIVDDVVMLTDLQQMIEHQIATVQCCDMNGIVPNLTANTEPSIVIGLRRSMERINYHQEKDIRESSLLRDCHSALHNEEASFADRHRDRLDQDVWSPKTSTA